ncbi:MAG TPA: GNAT family N-acetyltransferase [Longimicrobiaceae bacterium]|nr:GNAT family N-acetyltransferase [Longimicrobiaceae bacterium]
MTAPLRVRELGPDESVRPFVDLAWKINARDPSWVPPLRMAVEGLLDRRKHPFHQHADAAYLLAERGGEAVGRIAAVVNHRYNRFHGDRTGFFGLFECADDAEAARALVEAASAWLRERGMERMMGPMNLSTNDELSSPGVLVEGFDAPPAVMMSHNPPFYARLLEGAGLGKEKDLLAYWMASPEPPARAVAAMERLARRIGVRIRSVRMKELKEEVRRVQEVYNAAWSQNWGFVPMTEAEFEHMAKEMRPVVDPELVLLAEKEDGEPVGFLLALPDLNRAFRHLPDGRLFPFGLFRFLWHRRRIDSLRVLTLGLKPGYQHLGLGAAMYLHAFRVAAARGYRTGEGSWILEDNLEMRGAMEKMGATPYKRYRVFQTPLGNGR